MDNKIKHDVIVCVHNGAEDVEKCLLSLIRHKGEINNIIIIDDNSEVGTKHILKKFEDSYKFISVVTLTSQHYYTRAANIGLKKSNADLKTLLNSDTIVTSGWDKGIRKNFSLYPQIGIVGPLSNAASTQSVPGVEGSENQTAINTLPTGVSIDDFSSYIESIAKDAPKPLVPLVHGFCFTISQAVIERIGYFDEINFPRGYGEENDYCFRAEDAGFILSIATDVFVFHAKSKSYKSDERESFMNDGMNALIRKYSVRRIENAVSTMRSHPYLERMRLLVNEKWSDYYS